MNQKLFKQIRNEWRSNLWLCLELLIVSVVLWYIVDYFYVSKTLYSRPLGFDVEHCYLIHLNEVNDKSPDFKAYESNEQIVADKKELLMRLQRRPEVEAASLSVNAYPYNESNSGGEFTLDTLKTSGYTIRRIISPDFLRVFRYTGVNDETPEQLAEILSRGKALVSDNLMNYDHPEITSMQPYTGRRMYMYQDSTNTFEIGAAIKPVLYFDYMQGQMNRSVVQLLTENEYGWADELCVRVRENMDNDFAEKLMADSEKQLRVGNMYVADVSSFADIRDNVMRSEHQKDRNYITCMAFLLVNIFLGLLGTFWFRTQQRTADIAIRKVSGASGSNIFALLLGEGLILLSVVTPIALIIDINIAHNELNFYLAGDYLTWPRMLFCGLVSYAAMAVMICLGIAIPAWRAMHIAPAEALRDE